MLLVGWCNTLKIHLDTLLYKHGPLYPLPGLSTLSNKMICSHFDQWFVNPSTRKLRTFSHQAVVFTNWGYGGYCPVTAVVSFMYVN